MADIIFVFIVVVVIGVAVYFAIQKNRKPTYKPSRKMYTPKTKQAQFPPLELTIEDAWVKCEVEMERGTVTPITQLMFSFYDEGGNNVHAKSYGSEQAQSYQRQLSKILKTHGFELSENSDNREWTKYIYVRTPESP